jgi:hypothetical protein
MRVLKEILLIFALVFGLSLAVSAQKDDQKKPPPKGNPPVVNPGREKPPPPPKGNDKPKKPGGGYALEIAIKESDSAKA